MTNETFGFEKALNIIKSGGKVTRDPEKKWFIFLVYGSSFNVSRAPLDSILEVGTAVHYHAHIDIMYDRLDNKIAVWNPTVHELLKEDWMVV